MQEIVAKKADGEEETLEQYVAKKKLIGWKNDWILRDVCQKNPNDMKGAFMRAIDVLRTQHGAEISHKYWKFFKTHKLGRIIEQAKEDGPKLW